MPAFEEMDRCQKCVYWEADGFDEYGKFKFLDPVELEVRWVPVTRVVADKKGNEITTSADVVVDQDVLLGSLMWLGELDLWNGTGSAGDDEPILQVAVFNSTTDLKGREVRRTANLVYYMGEL